MTPESADGGAHATGDRLREFIDEMVSEASERQGQAEVYRIMREWSHEEASEAEARALTKWAKKLTKAVRELVLVPPQITIVKLTDEQAVSALCILDGCQHMKAVPPAPSGAPDDLRAIAAFCRQTARDHINPSMAWFVETADAIEAALAGGVAAPASSAPQPETPR